jgi:hypothetical protein
MPLPTSINSYNDVRDIVDSAIKHGSGAKLTFPSRNEATRFRQRFYTLRKLLRERSADDLTPYDNCVLRDGGDETSLRLEITSAQPVTVTFDNPAATVEVSPPLEPQDDMVKAALEFARSLGIKP